MDFDSSSHVKCVFARYSVPISTFDTQPKSRRIWKEYGRHHRHTVSRRVCVYIEFVLGGQFYHIQLVEFVNNSRIEIKQCAYCYCSYTNRFNNFIFVVFSPLLAPSIDPWTNKFNSNYNKTFEEKEYIDIARHIFIISFFCLLFLFRLVCTHNRTVPEVTSWESRPDENRDLWWIFVFLAVFSANQSEDKRNSCSREYRTK